MDGGALHKLCEAYLVDAQLQVAYAKTTFS